MYKSLKNPHFKAARKYRPFKDEDRRAIWKAAASSGLLINLLEDLEKAGYFKRDLKRKAKAFVKALEVFESEIADSKSIEGNGLNKDEVWAQQEASYRYFENWLDAAFLVDERHFQRFDKYIEQGIKIYANEKQAGDNG